MNQVDAVRNTSAITSSSRFMGLRTGMYLRHPATTPLTSGRDLLKIARGPQSPGSPCKQPLPVAQLRDLHIVVAECCTHEPANAPHQNKERHVPHIVEHARAVVGQAVGVQPEISIAPKAGLQDKRWMLLQQRKEGIRAMIHKGLRHDFGAFKMQRHTTERER